MRAVALQRRELIGFGPAMNDRPAAVRMALSVAAPVLGLLLAGRPELIVYAVFGSFTAMYGKVETHQLRLTHQTQAAFLLVAGATIGAGAAGYMPEMNEMPLPGSDAQMDQRHPGNSAVASPFARREPKLARYRQRVDFHEHDFVREVDEHRGAARQLAAGDVFGDEFAVDIVHGREIVARGEVDAEHDDVLH